MSRVHEALRRAGETAAFAPFGSAALSEAATRPPSIDNLLAMVQSVPYDPPPDELIFDVLRPQDPLGEEFRTVRTRINHLQSLQPIHTVIVTSPSPAEGKSFVAANLALAEAQLAGNLTLLCDFDFRRPVIHKAFGIDRAPGLSDYLEGKVPITEAMRRIGDGNLYVMPAGEPVMNPLELLNLREVKQMLDRLAGVFNWIILDSPPLLFAADANLLSTYCHGAILVARIGVTSIDSIQRTTQSLCQNNILGIVLNGAHRGEFYSKYDYYRSSNSAPDVAPI